MEQSAANAISSETGQNLERELKRIRYEGIYIVDMNEFEDFKRQNLEEKEYERREEMAM